MHMGAVWHIDLCSTSWREQSTVTVWGGQARTVSWSTAAGLLVTEVDVRVALLVPVLSCQMAALTLRPGCAPRSLTSVHHSI